jgi:hypothetical protein
MSISNSTAGTPNSRIARADGINFAWQNGASVINNSWGSSISYQVIDDAILNAVNLGRGGLGSVVIFSSGNNDTNSIGYPSNDPNVLSVGAMSMCGQRKNPNYCDGEQWGSNFGTGLDVVAPGVRISTTDRQGNLGYNTNNSSGDYFDSFNGTSSSAPQVAGIAALILSVNCQLTQQQVRNIIESTSDKLPSYSYTLGQGENVNLSWNSETGYGKVNAFAAVSAAAPQIQGSTQFCNTETYTIPNLPAGASVNWTVSPSYLVTTTSSGNSITLTKAYNGNIVLSATVSSACGDVNLNPLPIKVGTPVFDIPSFTNSENGMPFWCSNATGNSFTLENTNHTGVYEARLLNYPSLTVFATNNNAYPGSDVFGYVPAGYYVFQIRATNNCGTSDWIETEVESTDCSNNFRISSNYTLYPNPANDEITIEYTALQGGENLSKPLQQKDVKLYNQKGEILLSSLWKENEQKLRLETKNVPDGTYYLHITEGKETIKKQIIIKH